MADYIPFKKKQFKLEKEATAWTKNEKKKYGGTRPVRIDTVYNPGTPFPWEGVVLLKGDDIGA